MSPRKAERRPGKDAARTGQPSPTATIAQRSGNGRPPLAPASVYAPLGRRRWWWYAYRCRICGAHLFGRSKTLDAVTGVRRAGCGHHVNIMAARVYGASS